MKWAIELRQFEISYKGRSAIKARALVDFVIKLLNVSVLEKEPSKKCENYSRTDHLEKLVLKGVNLDKPKKT